MDSWGMLNVDTIAIRDDMSSSFRRKQQVVGTFTKSVCK